MPTDYWPGDNMNMYTCASTFALILQFYNSYFTIRKNSRELQSNLR